MDDLRFYVIYNCLIMKDEYKFTSFAVEKNPPQKVSNPRPVQQVSALSTELPAPLFSYNYGQKLNVNLQLRREKLPSVFEIINANLDILNMRKYFAYLMLL